MNTMNTIRVLVLCILCGSPISSFNESGAGELSAAVHIAACLKANKCTQRRLEFTTDGRLMYSVGFATDELGQVIFSRPANAARLEVHWASHLLYKSTFIDTNLDGTVDHIIEVDRDEGAVLIYDKEGVLYPDAQRIYAEILRGGQRLLVPSGVKK